jgi:transcriptional regulator with PAS, ATPase and Fis domain
VDIATGTQSNCEDVRGGPKGTILGFLLFRAGPSEGDGVSDKWVALEPGLTLGRSAEAKIALGGALCSRIHARVEEQCGLWVLCDLASKNGTFVNGAKIEQAPLAEQDVVRLGEWVGIVVARRTEDVRVLPAVGSISDSVFGGPKTREVLGQVERIAESELRVCLVGETGTGKEVLARELHRLSDRSGALISMNCAAVPEQLAEGELFGYRKGAFTGADRSHLGHFRAAHEGTLFLDEILDLPLSVQAKLLRALEERRVVPLGQSSSEPADARVVCASQVSLRDAVEAGKFRADLYGRLAGIEVRLSPLRARREEVWPLLRAFLESKTGVPVQISPGALEQLLAYDWPLNVREVVQLAERMVSLHRTLTTVSVEHLPEAIATFRRNGPREHEPVQAQVASPSDRPSERQTERQTERPSVAPKDELAERFVEVLRQAGGNVTAAAERMGISRPRAYRLLERLEGVSAEDIRLGPALGRARELVQK